MTDKDRINHLDGQHRSLLAENNKMQAERNEARSALQQAQADAAAMREALERTDCFCSRSINHMCPRCLTLATDSGKAVLARLEEAQWIIQNIYGIQPPEVSHRLGAWLKEAK